jgi:hypothetical protein
MPRERKTSTLKVRLSSSQKQKIQENANIAGVSVSRWVLVQSLKGSTGEFGLQRRKAEGPLINARLYADLGRLLGLFNQRQKSINSALVMGSAPPGDQGEVAAAIALLHQIRKEIALQRLENTFNQI